jgi:uncharacterized protein (TIGR03437 family)
MACSKIRLSLLSAAAILAGSALAPCHARADSGAIVPVNLSNSLGPNDDDSAGPIALGIGGENGISFFGQSFTQIHINNNGNLTFGGSLRAYTPNGLATGVGRPIIAPFFADVDTTGEGSGVVTYGNAIVNGYNAFVANYINVGYFEAHTNKLNSFQVILLDRSDTGPGNFDIEFNYNQIQWETGDASGGTNGLGGISAVVGYANGLGGNADVNSQLPGSLVNGALIDGGPDALIGHSLGSSVPGRYIFQVRSGIIVVGPSGGPLTVTGINLGTIPLGSAISGGVQLSGGTPPYSIAAAGALPPGVFVSPTGIAGTPTKPGPYSVGVIVTDSAGAIQSTSFTFSVFGFTGSSLPAGITGAPYLASVGAAGGTQPYKFVITGLPPGFSASSAGFVSGISNAPVNIPVSVTATENNGAGVSVSGTQTLVIGVPPALQVPAATLPAGLISSAYSSGLTATGGAPPYTWTLSSGTLPAGLALRSAGTVTGLPLQSGAFTFGVRATDFTGASAVGAVSLTIAPPALALTPASGALATGMATVDYPAQSITVSGGTPPYKFAIAGSLPAGLSLSYPGTGSTATIAGTPAAAAVGSSSFTVTVTDSTGASASALLSIAIRPYNTDLLVSTSALTFNLVAGSAVLPPAQQVAVQSTVPMNPNISYTDAGSPSTPAWLTITPGSGTTPSTFTVSLTSQAALLPVSGTPYAASINIQCQSPAPCGFYPPQTVSITLNLDSPPPALAIGSNLVSFTTPSGAPQAMSQSVTIQNTGGGSVGLASAACAASWCSVTGLPGSLSAGASAALSVSVNPAGLGAGYYRTNLTIASSVGTYIVPVTLFIAAASSMALAPAGAQFEVVSPGGVPGGPVTSFLVDYSGSATAFSASTNTNWITLNTTGGTVSSSVPATVNYGFNTAAIAGMGPGVYYGTITVAITGASAVNSPQSFEVVLNVLPAATQQRPQPTPAGLLFITSSAAAPPAQNIAVAASSTSPAAFQASASTVTGGNWLQVSPAEGTATPGSPASVQVSVNPTMLQPGIYSGFASIAYSAAAVRSVNVTLVVTPASVTAHDAKAATPSCTPTLMAPAPVGIPGNFSAPVAWPIPLTLQLVDNCGNFVTNGSVSAVFSNNDPPLLLSLADPRNGYYAATWTPRNSLSQVSITATASAPGLPTARAIIAGSVTPNGAPVLLTNYPLHIFNPLVGAALAPGTLVQISGTGLAVTSSTLPFGAPLPTTLNGTTAIVGGAAMPLQSVTPTSITAQLPFELMPGAQYQVLVSANGALTTPDTLQIAGTSPGVWTSAWGLVNAFHLSGAAVTEAAPAAPGEQIYLISAGLGATDTPVADGAVTPAAMPINALDQPTMTINNEPATISFAGLQPGAVGVYQVTFTVPADAPNGDLNLILSQDGNPANTGVLPVHK